MVAHTFVDLLALIPVVLRVFPTGDASLKVVGKRVSPLRIGCGIGGGGGGMLSCIESDDPEALRDDDHRAVLRCKKERTPLSLLSGDG